MNLRRLLNLVRADLVTVGLVVSPLTTRAAAADPQENGTMGMSMSADMPCCPDEQKNKDCQDCPLVMCILKTAQAGPSLTAVLPVRHAIRTSHSVLDEMLADGLDRPPPDQLPRNLV